MIKPIYRVIVPIEDGVDVLYKIDIDEELSIEFDNDFIRATDKSFNAQTDGYNGEMFADFTNLEEAQEAEIALVLLAKKVEGMMNES